MCQCHVSKMRAAKVNLFMNVNYSVRNSKYPSIAKALEMTRQDCRSEDLFGHIANSDRTMSVNWPLFQTLNSYKLIVKDHLH